MHRIRIPLPPLLALSVLVPASALAGPPATPAGEFGTSQTPVVVDGIPVEPCGWPTTLRIDGCTATLIHPRAIATAQHCGDFDEVRFTDKDGGKKQSVDVLDCVDTGSSDARICELAEEVTAIPPTPVLYGCEIDEFLEADQDVIVVGFGRADADEKQSGGVKRWAPHIITDVDSKDFLVAEWGAPMSPCYGDSGGPVFVQVADGSWRVLGTLRGGTKQGPPCNGAAEYKRLDTVVPHFEAQTGIDITPCFDGETGAWDPGPECGGFFAGDHSGEGSSGSWTDWCAGTPASGYGDQCGAPWTDGDDSGDSGGDDEGDSGDSGDDGSMDDGADDGSWEDGGDDGADDGADDGSWEDGGDGDDGSMDEGADDGSMDDGSTDGSADEGADDGSADDGSADDGSGDGSGDESGDTGGSNTDGGGFTGGFGTDVAETGCSCSAEPDSRGAALLTAPLMLLLGLGRRRRRKAQDSSTTGQAEEPDPR